MRSPARSVAWLLPFLLTACFHKTHPINTTQYLPPPSAVPKPEIQAVELPPSATTIPSVPLTSDAELEHRPSSRQGTGGRSTRMPRTLPSKPSTTLRRRRSETPAVSAIGQLSSGNLFQFATADAGFDCGHGAGAEWHQSDVERSGAEDGSPHQGVPEAGARSAGLR